MSRNRRTCGHLPVRIVTMHTRGTYCLLNLYRLYRYTLS